MASIERSQFLVAYELTPPRSVHTQAHRRAFLFGQAEYAVSTTFNLIHGLFYLAEQLLGQGGNPF